MREGNRDRVIICIIGIYALSVPYIRKAVRGCTFTLYVHNVRMYSKSIVGHNLTTREHKWKERETFTGGSDKLQLFSFFVYTLLIPDLMLELVPVLMLKSISCVVATCEIICMYFPLVSVWVMLVPCIVKTSIKTLVKGGWKFITVSGVKAEFSLYFNVECQVFFSDSKQ